MNEPEELSGSGAPIYRHRERERPFEISHGDEQTIEAVGRHIAEHVGVCEMVFHEIVSELVHIDVHWVPPSLERNFHTLVTSGMSERAMTTPARFYEMRFAELVICLPPEWPLSQDDFEDERHYWPIRWLKTLARLPHEFKTWLALGHTVPNGDPPQPFADNTKLCCNLLLPPISFGEFFPTLTVDAEKTIHFYSLVPLYREEMEFKLTSGLEPLLERFEKAGVGEVVDIRRKNVCQKRWGFFG